MDSKILYEQDKGCPICKGKFKVIKVRNSHCIVDSRDQDFCIHYQNANPYLYGIWVCPHCGYASPESIFSKITKEECNIIALALRGKEIKINFTGERSTETGIASYKLAIYFCNLRGCKNSILANLYLKTAWLYRGLDDSRERDYLIKALDHYKLAYDEDPFPIGNLTDLAVRYLIGELYRRIGEYRESIGWFNRVVNDSRSRTEPKITNMAREQWRLAKEQLHNYCLSNEISVLEEDQVASTRENNEVNDSVGKNLDQLDQKFSEPKKSVERIKLSSMVHFYADQIEWVKAVVVNSNGKKITLDSQSVIRAILDLILDIEPTDIKCESEQELTKLLQQKIMENK